MKSEEKEQLQMELAEERQRLTELVLGIERLDAQIIPLQRQQRALQKEFEEKLARANSLEREIKGWKKYSPRVSGKSHKAKSSSVVSLNIEKLSSEERKALIALLLAKN